MTERRKLKLTINDGFGPQPLGDMSIAQFFDDQSSILLTMQDRKEQVLWEKVDTSLKKKLTQFKTKVAKATPSYKFDILTL